MQIRTEEKEARKNRYAIAIEASKRVRWDIDRDVIRGRSFDTTKKFMPDSLALIGRFEGLGAGELRLVSQIQGRTYSRMFGVIERFIPAKMLEVTREHALGDQSAVEALVRFTDEELKHQELFRRLEVMMAEKMPAGHEFLPEANAVAGSVLAASTWAVLAFTCLVELVTQSHYRQSIEPGAGLSELWKDVFLFHWREEAQHAILDELEWRREDAKIDAAARDRGVTDLIGLVGAVDAMMAVLAKSDAAYFAKVCGRSVGEAEAARIEAAFLEAYRWQYIVSGAQEPRFQAILGSIVSAEQGKRIGAALAPIVARVAAPQLARAA